MKKVKPTIEKAAILQNAGTVTHKEVLNIADDKIAFQENERRKEQQNCSLFARKISAYNTIASCHPKISFKKPLNKKSCFLFLKSRRDDLRKLYGFGLNTDR